MISELFFCRYFTSFWTETLPGSDHYVKLINSGLQERFCPPIEISESSEKRSLINVMSYELFNMIVLNQLEQKELLSLKESSELIIEIQKKAIKFLTPVLMNPKSYESINNEEIKIITYICKTLLQRFSTKKQLTLSPKFPGCGLIQTSEGDILEDKTLVEIKAGDRNFSILDLRQLLIYGALNYASKSQYEIEKFCLFNPRTGLQWIEDIDVIAYNLASTTAADLYTEILGFLTQGYGSI